MSIVTIMKVPGDTAKFREFFDSHKEQVAAISARAQAAGCTSHVFSQGDGVTVAVDHWDSQAAFEKFLADPEIGETMAGAGASGPPEIEIFEVIDVDSW
jgi:heme-degrading monooxygenase HmoA